MLLRTKADQNTFPPAVFWNTAGAIHWIMDTCLRKGYAGEPVWIGIGLEDGVGAVR